MPTIENQYAEPPDYREVELPCIHILVYISYYVMLFLKISHYYSSQSPGSIRS